MPRKRYTKEERRRDEKLCRILIIATEIAFAAAFFIEFARRIAERYAA